MPGLARCAKSQSLRMTSEIQARGAPFRQRTCFSTVSKLYQNHISTKHWGCPSSEEQIPQVVGKTEKTRNGMDGLEGNFTRPRQVRYQAALRPDYIDSTSVARFNKLRVFLGFDTALLLSSEFSTAPYQYPLPPCMRPSFY